MSSGAYVALSGLRARAEQLDRLAGDLANSATSGYKGERTTTVASERAASAFNAALQSAIDVAQGPGKFDFRPGALSPTGRDLDMAVEGRGFFAVETPAGVRYTRNGQFTRRADGVLATQDGHAVLGEDGPIELPVAKEPISVGEDGQLRAGTRVIGRPRLVDFADYDRLAREEGTIFRAPEGAATVPAPGRVVGGTLEGSNVSVVERMTQLTAISRSFEALQRGVSMMMNDLDGRAISELGRR